MIKGLLAHCCHGGAWVALGAAGLGVLAAARLVAIQAAPPALVPTSAVVTGPDDRALLDQLGVDPVVGIVTAPGWLATTVTRGAEIKELGTVLEAEGYGALRHEAAAVRVLTAFHLLTKHPERAATLTPLLADDGGVIQVVYEDPARATTVRDLVVDMLCAVAPKAPHAAKVLTRAGDDPRRLVVRRRIRACLEGLAQVSAAAETLRESRGARGLRAPKIWRVAATHVETLSRLVGFPVHVDPDVFAGVAWTEAARGARAAALDWIAVPVSRAAIWVRAIFGELAPAKAVPGGTAKADESGDAERGADEAARTKSAEGELGVTRI
jgi:hypothetical protein